VSASLAHSQGQAELSAGSSRQVRAASSRDGGAAGVSGAQARWRRVRDAIRHMRTQLRLPATKQQAGQLLVQRSAWTAKADLSCPAEDCPQSISESEVEE
jgi:hypothetical protein